MYPDNYLPSPSPNTLYYLATPYTHADSRKQRWRFRAAARVAGYLIKKGYQIFCPITHTVPIEDENMNLPTDPMWWVETVDKAFIERCDALIVVLLPGWQSSKGVSSEIKKFVLMNKPVFYVEATDLFSLEELEALA